LLRLRIPGWAQDARLTVNGKTAKVDCRPASYATLKRNWVAGDMIKLDLPMPVRMIIADPLIEQTRNQVAVMRGPIVYCLESIDLPKEVPLEDICLPAGAKWKIQHEPDLLGGVTVLTTKALVIKKIARKDIGGYRQVSEAKPRRIDIRMIPYYAWNNREEPKMTVWLPVRW
ncbi:glycoside hydrolase family 127 protein, partial [Planctomycetota bacterium]